MASNNTTAPSTNMGYTTAVSEIESLAFTLNAYYTPPLILLGIIGNILSIFVFFKTKLKIQSTSLYLSALAASDTIFLLQLLPPWLNTMAITNFFHRKGFCQIFVYSTYTSCCLSAWLTVAFTVERFVAVLYPLRRNRMCTVARAKSVIAMLVAVSSIFNAPVMMFAAPTKNDCNIDQAYVKHAARFNLLDTVFSLTLPLVLIFVLNCCIVWGVRRRGRTRRAQALAHTPRPRGTPQHHARVLPPLRAQHHVTKMLLIVSTVFFVLNVPAYSFRVYAYANNLGSGEYSGQYAALQTLALMFFNTNFGINFILYCMSGSNFRRELCQSIPWLRRYARRRAARQRGIHHIGRGGSGTASYVSGIEASTSPGQDRGAALRCARRHHSEPYIERWTFDNRRELRALAQPIVPMPMPVDTEMPSVGARRRHTPALLRQNEPINWVEFSDFEPRRWHSSAVADQNEELIEMQELGPRTDHTLAAGLPHQNQLVDRPFMFPLFPMGRIITQRRRNSGPVTSGTPST